MFACYAQAGTTSWYFYITPLQPTNPQSRRDKGTCNWLPFRVLLSLEQVIGFQKLGFGEELLYRCYIISSVNLGCFSSIHPNLMLQEEPYSIRTVGFSGTLSLFIFIMQFVSSNFRWLFSLLISLLRFVHTTSVIKVLLLLFSYVLAFVNISLGKEDLLKLSVSDIFTTSFHGVLFKIYFNVFIFWMYIIWR